MSITMPWIKALQSCPQSAEGIGGYEVDVLKILSQKLNFKINFVNLPISALTEQPDGSLEVIAMVPFQLALIY